MNAAIIGWSHSPFGNLKDRSLEDLIVSVSRDALASAGIEAGEVDEIFLGHFNAGLCEQDFTAALTLEASKDLRFKPATRVENACATGSAAVYQGLRAIASGQARVVLVVGAEKMTDRRGPEVAAALCRAAYRPEEAANTDGFAGVFARIAELYFARYGDASEAMARIAAKNHANGLDNPYAHLRKDLGFDFCNGVSESNPLVSGPLRRTDCSPVSDGAAALVLVGSETAGARGRAVGFRAAAHVQDYLPMNRRDILAFEGCRLAWQKALAIAAVGLGDLSFVETHDCFTIAELLEYEAMGLAAPGCAAQIVLEGRTGRSGPLPVNPSGGLKAKGHPVGATGVSMHVLAAMQLCGEAGDMQVPGAELAGIFNMGGAAVANYVSILERVR